MEEQPENPKATDITDMPVSNEEEDEDEEEEEEVEPLLKYERISNDLYNIFKKDAASCITVNSKFLALGSHQGMIYILDHLGNIINKSMPSHSVTVNEISIDERGEFIGSCSDDGRVFVTGLYSEENNHKLNLDRPVKALALDPFYYKTGSGRKFVTGDERLILHEKALFSRLKTVVLHENDGMIRNIKWCNNFIAWSNNSGVRVYDINAHCTISLIKRDADSKYRADQYHCHLCWRDETTLLIGWADSIKICCVKKRVLTEVTVKDVPEHYVEITCMFNTDFLISGLGWLDNKLVVLSYNKEEAMDDGQVSVASTSLSVASATSEGTGQRPHLRIIEAQNFDYTEVSTDILSLRGHAKYRCNDYHLSMLPQEGLFFILGPKDLVLAKPRDGDDHITWLMEHEKYEEAMEAVNSCSKELKTHTPLQVGRSYLDYLMKKERYTEAAQLCQQVLGRDAKLWQEEVLKFHAVRQLQAITPYLPRGIGNEPRLDVAIYEMVMNEYLNSNLEGFQNLLREWSPSLYSVGTIINAVLDKLLYVPSDPVLLQCLGDLYIHQRKYDKALSINLKLGNKDVFALIKKHDLYHAVQDEIEKLMDLNRDAAIKMFLDNMDKLPIKIVVGKLENRTEHLFEYLHRLHLKDPSLGEAYHDLQVKLYAEHRPKQLLRFLETSTSYHLQEALRVCETYQYIPEMVYLLARMGNIKQALQVIMLKQEDIQRAIEFCKEHDDKDLWEDLIQYSLQNSALINVLLQNIGTHVDPTILIKRIENGLEVEGLRDSLVKILQDYNVQISLQEGCKKILVSDCFTLLDKLHKQQRRGVQVPETKLCLHCNQKLFGRGFRNIASIVVFSCKHAFHEICLLTIEPDICPVCHIDKQCK